MTQLSEAEMKHLENFVGLRPEWDVCVLSERMIDEEQESREHKYGRAHPYVTGMYYVLQHMKGRGACSVLDIGSPIAQNVAVGALPGIDLTVLDVRPHVDAEAIGLKWCLGNATAIPYPAASWDMVTSLWVMGHVGDGRYGDALDAEGDHKMLEEVARVLKPGGTFIIGAGLVAEEPAYIYNLHRIYSWPWLRSAFYRAGFDLIDEKELFVGGDIFMRDGTVVKQDGGYALAQLRKRP